MDTRIKRFSFTLLCPCSWSSDLRGGMLIHFLQEGLVLSVRPRAAPNCSASVPVAATPFLPSLSSPEENTAGPERTRPLPMRTRPISCSTLSRCPQLLLPAVVFHLVALPGVLSFRLCASSRVPLRRCSRLCPQQRCCHRRFSACDWGPSGPEPQPSSLFGSHCRLSRCPVSR